MSRTSEAWLNLTHVVAGIETALSKILQDRHGLGLSEYRALQILSQSPDFELRMQDLASYLRLTQSSVSRVVERLERAELTLRDLCPDDKRGVYTVLTDKGKARFKEAQPDYETTLSLAIKEQGCEGLLSVRLVRAEPA